MRTFAFIFARGGSKGLPGKNVKILGGIPLLAHGIQLAQSLETVERIFVSTDDPEIATVAKAFGAEIIQRPGALATDTASEWVAWQHAIGYLRDELKLSFDVFLSLPATSPLRSREDVCRCLDALDERTDVVIAVSPSARNPYFNMVFIDESGYAKTILGDARIQRRQDAPDAYDITTVAYVSRPQFILDHGRLFDGHVKAVVVPKERAVDIDDKFDFLVAEALLSHE